MSSLALAQDISANPIDVLEELVSANDWPFDRSSECELAVQMSGHWCDYHLWFSWQERVSAMYFSCHMDIRVPETKRGDVTGLVATVNEQLWLGHFELSSDNGALTFRHTVPLRGTRGASVEQLEDLMDTGFLECERFYPAIQLVIWGGRTASEALAVAAMETMGRA
jgi:hypothetical protein